MTRSRFPKPPMSALRRALLTFVAEMVLGFGLAYGLLLPVGKGSWGSLVAFLFGLALGVTIVLTIGLVMAARASGRSRVTQVWLGLLAVPMAFLALPFGVRLGLGGWGSLALMSIPGPVLVWWIGTRPPERSTN